MSGSTTSGVLKLQDVRDAILANEWVNYNPQNDPGTLWSWGYNAGGKLGLNIGCFDHRSSPVQVPGTSWVQISSAPASLTFAAAPVGARKSDGTLWVWGQNGFGELGQNDRVARSSPIQIPGTSWTDVSMSGNRMFARKNDGTLWGTGYNMGTGSNVIFSSPVQIPGTSWSQISAGGGHVLARKSDGTLWTWGENGSGQLGNNTTTPFMNLSAIQIPGTAWVDACVGNFYSSARKSDGTLWVWGSSILGQLGDGTTISKSSPVQVPGTSWVDISLGSSHSMARKSDGTLWGWGLNSCGQLGDNTTIYRSSPVQVPGTSWVDASSGTTHTLARKNDGTLWAWGGSFVPDTGKGPTPGRGERGDNLPNVNRSSPIQIPGTSWIDICAQTCASFARKSL